MKLISLKLLNYRRFRQEEIIFWDDFSLIFWKNGAWKSSILDAIGYALFGSGSSDFVRVKTELLKSHFLRDREPSKVELIFQYGMKTYRIVRVIDAWVRKLANDFIVENKDTLLGDDVEILWGTEVTNELIKIIWVDRNTFLRSVFAQQKDLEVLSWGKEERKNLIHSILGLDSIERLIVQVKKEQKEKKIAFEYLKEKVQNFDIETLETQLVDQKTYVETIQKKLDEHLKEKNILETSFQEIKTVFWAFQKQKEAHMVFQNQLWFTQNTLVSTQLQIKKYEEECEKISQKEILLQTLQWIDEKEKTLSLALQKKRDQKQLFVQLQSLKIDEKKYFQETESLKEQLKNLNSESLIQQKADLEKTLMHGEKSISEANNEITQLTTQLSQITKEATDLKTEIANIQTLWEHADCPTCKRSLQSHFPKLMEMFEASLQEKRALYKQKQELLQEKQSAHTLLQKLQQTAKNEFEEVNKKLQQRAVLDEKLQSAQKFFLQVQEKISTIWEVNYDEKTHQDVEEQYNDTKQKYALFLELSWEVKNKPHLIESLNEAKSKKITLESQEKTLKDDIKKLDFQEEIFEQKKQEYDQFEKIFSDKNNEIHLVKTQVLQAEFDHKQLLAKKEQFALQKKEMQSSLDEVSYLELKKNILGEYILHLLQYLKPNIEALTSEYFCEITDGKYSQVTLDEEYEILIDGKTLKLYSWGERDLVNLCFRLSLGQNLSQRRGNPINFLILDEVLGSQDKARQQNILLNLKKLEHKFSQILLISHLDEIKEFATNLIEIQSVNRDESRVVYW